MEGVVIDPDSGRWSRAAASKVWWRFGHTAVAAGDRAIIWGGCCGPAGSGSRAPGAVYDPKDDAWRPLEGGPAGNRSYHTAVWTGEEMIVWGGAVGRRARADGFAYDPRSDSWRTIPRAPLSPRRYHTAVWTGDEMIVWGGSEPRPGDRERVLTDGAAFDPERDEWRPIASTALLAEPRATLPVGVEPDFDAEWTGSEMTIWSRYGGARYDPERNGWVRIPAPPPRLRNVVGAQSVWTGDELIVWGGARDGDTFSSFGAAYDPSTDRWAAIPEPPIAGRDRHVAVWTGNGLLIWGGCCRGSRYSEDGALYVPD